MKKFILLLLLVNPNYNNNYIDPKVRLYNGTVLCVGDSTVYGLNKNLEDMVSFTEFIPGAINYSYPGWNSNTILLALKNVTIKPKYVVIRVLSPDSFAKTPVKTYKQNLIKIAKYFDAKVIFLDYPLMNPYEREYQDAIKEAANETNSIYLRTICQNYFNEYDVVHPTRKAAMHVAEVINETIAKLERAENSKKSITIATRY